MNSTNKPKREDIWGKLTLIFHESFLRDDIILTPALTAKDVHGWDSFKQVEIIMAVQEAFGIKLNTREIDGLRKVGDLVEIISRKGSLTDNRHR